MRERDTDPGAASVGAAALVARMLRLPIAAFVFGMEMFVATLHGLQRLADDGIDAVAGATVPSRDPRRPAAPSGPADHPEPVSPASPAGGPTDPDGNATPPRQKELFAMPDTNLNDDMLKLVRYKVLFVKRGYEVAFPEQEELVFDNMTDTAFVAWKIAEFIQQLNETVLPSKWVTKGYPFGEAEKPRDPEIGRKWQQESGGRPSERRVYWLPEGDKKFLRVYYEVLARYTREKFRHDEREVEVLEQIRDVIQDCREKGVAPGQGKGKPAGA